MDSSWLESKSMSNNLLTTGLTNLVILQSLISLHGWDLHLYLDPACNVSNINLQISRGIGNYWYFVGTFKTDLKMFEWPLMLKSERIKIPQNSIHEPCDKKSCLYGFPTSENRAGVFWKFDKLKIQRSLIWPAYVLTWLLMYAGWSQPFLASH